MSQYLCVCVWFLKIVFLLVSFVGYRPEECHHSDAVVSALMVMFSPVPIVLLLIAMVIFLFYPINEKQDTKPWVVTGLIWATENPRSYVNSHLFEFYFQANKNHVLFPPLLLPSSSAEATPLPNQNEIAGLPSDSLRQQSSMKTRRQSLRTRETSISDKSRSSTHGSCNTNHKCPNKSHNVAVLYDRPISAGVNPIHKKKRPRTVSSKRTRPTYSSGDNLCSFSEPLNVGKSKVTWV